jgi:hypothetical protein
MNADPVTLQSNSPPSEHLDRATKPRDIAMHLAVPCLLLAAAGLGVFALSRFDGNPWGMMPAGLVGIALVALCQLMMGAVALWMWAHPQKQGG